MDSSSNAAVTILKYPNKNIKKRKTGLNQNKDGSIRKMRNKVYLDFYYLEERVRISTGLNWNEENRKKGRELLDKVIILIKEDRLCFADVFPHSNKKDYFTEKENRHLDRKVKPRDVGCVEYFWKWFNKRKDDHEVTDITLRDYKLFIRLYLEPFFEGKTFGEINRSILQEFRIWMRNNSASKKELSERYINKCFIPLRMICTEAAIEYGWIEYNPFFGFKKLAEKDAYENINPFSKDEQKKVIDALPEHWKPYFMTAFEIGARPGELIAIYPTDIDWENKKIRIERAMTYSFDDGYIEGTTKNRYSRRTIKLRKKMLEALQLQQEVWNKNKGKYFFCSKTGEQIHLPNLRNRVWKKALNETGITYRDMKQTRHTFATHALATGENPLWIANVMGHRNTEMVIKVYSKYIEHFG